MTTESYKLGAHHCAHESGAIDAIAHTLALWFARSRQLKQMPTLTREQLQDMGISEAEALREAAKPFWRV